MKQEIRINHLGGGCYRDRQKAYQVIAAQLNRYLPESVKLPLAPGYNARRAQSLVNSGAVEIIAKS